MTHIRCAECSATTEYRLGKKFCSKSCKAKNHKKRNKRFAYQSNNGLPPATVGAVSELLVSCDLMKNGYEVHRALSPSSHSDLLAIKDGSVYRFEVRTGIYNVDKTLSYGKTNIRAENVAIVTHVDNAVHYEPESLIPAFQSL